MTMLTILTALLALSGGVIASEAASETEQPKAVEHQVVAI
jgi:hypothetical protein